MQDSTLALLIDRVTRLEQEVSRLRRVGGVAAVILAGFAALIVMLVLHSTPVAIHAERVVFADAAGRPRATLGVSRSDPPALQLVDPDGRVRWQAP